MKTVVFVAAACLTIVMFAPRSAGAQTITACVLNSNGSVRLVSSASQCRNNETPVAWNIAGPAGPQGPAGTNGTNGSNGADGAQGPAGPAGPGLMRLFDANDQLIGTMQSNTQVVMQPDAGQILNATITDNATFVAGFNQTATGLFVYFKNPDCAGEPYFRIAGLWGASVIVNNFVTPVLNYPGYTLLYGQLPSESITAQSQYGFTVFPPFGYVCQNISQAMRAGKVATLPLDQFATPFHLGQ